MINKVIITSLPKYENEQGRVLHMLRQDDPNFEEFGEIYFSVVNPGVIKGWHLHLKATSNYAVIKGEIKLVLLDNREKSPTKGEIQEVILNENDHYYRVTIPPKVWSSFKCTSSDPAILANCSTKPHKKEDVIREEINTTKIPYKWV